MLDRTYSDHLFFSDLSPFHLLTATTQDRTHYPLYAPSCLSSFSSIKLIYSLASHIFSSATVRARRVRGQLAQFAQFVQPIRDYQCFRRDQG